MVGIGSEGEEAACVDNGIRNLGVSWTCDRSVGSFHVIMSKTKYFFFNLTEMTSVRGPVLEKRALKVAAEFFCNFYWMTQTDP